MSPRRIVIYGVTGSGKTTLAHRLAQALGLTHIELDALYHGPNWTPAPDDVFLARVREAIDAAPEGWVADGKYGLIRPLLLPLADTVVWLRLPWRVSYVSMLRRTLRRMVSRQELWNGNRETLRNIFLEKDSLLLWGIHHHRASIRSVRRSLDDIPHSADVLILRSRRDVEALIRRLTKEHAGAVARSAPVTPPAKSPAP